MSIDKPDYARFCMELYLYSALALVIQHGSSAGPRCFLFHLHILFRHCCLSVQRAALWPGGGRKGIQLKPRHMGPAIQLRLYTFSRTPPGWACPQLQEAAYE